MLFPVRDHNPSSVTPYVSYTLIAVNVIVYLLYGFGTQEQIWSVYMDWALVPAEVSAGEALHTFLTCMFMHGSPMHLLGNMLFLWIFGDNLEDYLGHFGMLVFYIITGIVASLAQVVLDPASMIPTVGASGAIAGLMGGYMLLFPKARVDVMILMRMVPLPAIFVLAGWLAMQLFGGFGSLGSTGGGVAYWAHIGGFAGGIAAVAALWLILPKPRNWPEMPHAEAPPIGRKGGPWGVIQGPRR